MNKLKYAAFLFLTLILTLPSFSQLDMNAGLPTDPKLMMGKLSNGLTYYIKENKKPEKKLS